MQQRIHAPAIRARKGGEPIVCLTAYTAPMAALLDEPCDLLLVGDSLAMVVYGFDSTLGADLEMMIRHGQSVVRATRKACVVVDLPFGTYQRDPEQAFESSAEVLRATGCQAVKLEGGREMAETVAFLTSRGVPVMGHVGLTPQSVNSLGGYRARGKDAGEAGRIRDDAAAIAEAGAFSLVIEGVSEPVAREVTEAVEIPVIGIGASAACDGQILVVDDMLGLTTGHKPKFVKEYALLHENVSSAVRSYADEVRARRFPSAEFLYR